MATSTCPYCPRSVEGSPLEVSEAIDDHIARAHSGGASAAYAEPAPTWEPVNDATGYVVTPSNPGAAWTPYSPPPAFPPPPAPPAPPPDSGPLVEPGYAPPGWYTALLFIDPATGAYDLQGPEADLAQAALESAFAESARAGAYLPDGIRQQLVTVIRDMAQTLTEIQQGPPNFQTLADHAIRTMRFRMQRLNIES